jgi:hypothetical protein
MAEVNQYSSGPAQSNFVNTYSPIPFSELMQASAMKQQAYETGLDNMMKTYEDTYNLKYIPGSKDEAYIKNQVIPAAKQVVDKYSNMDLSNPIVRRQMRTDFNTSIDKNRVNDIQTSHAGWIQNQKWRQQLQAKGEYKSVLDTPDAGYDTSIQGVYSKMTPAALDYRKEAKNYFTDIKGSSYINPNTGEVRTYVDPRKIENVASGQVQTFLDTIEGQQMVKEWKSKNPSAKVSDEAIAHQYLTEVGKEFTYDQHAGFVPEWYLGDKKKKDPGAETLVTERSPMVNVANRTLKSTDFTKANRLNLKSTSGKEPEWYEARPSTGYGAFEASFPNTYKESVLQKDEVKNIVKVMPQQYQDMYNKLVDPKFKESNPTQYSALQDQFYDKMNNSYKQLEKEMQRGFYVQAYYPHAVEGIPASRLNNSDFWTDYLFGTKELSKVGSANVVNRDFVDTETGESINGKKFLEEVVKPAVKDNKNAEVRVTGSYSHENLFSSLTNNENFSNAYQVNINGHSYAVSGPAKNAADPNFDYKRNANKSYNLTTLNPGITIDERDGTIKKYDNGIYSVADKNSGEILGQSDNFTKAYEDAVKNLMSKQVKSNK